MICGRRQEKLDAAVDANPGLVAIACDITDDEQVRAMLATIESKHGGLDLLINNAAVMYAYEFGADEDTLGKIEREVTINTVGPLKVTALALPQLKAKKGGVVMISSGLAYVPWPAAPVYCATKSFLHFFTRSLRRQLEPHGVGVFEVLPPVVATDMAANMDEGAMKKCAACQGGPGRQPRGHRGGGRSELLLGAEDQEFGHW